MGLFDKKYCDICGKEIKLLGNRKLDDGNMCKDCASKLSPWFSGRRHSSVAAIKEQLAYREANKAEVEKFQLTRTIGDGTKILIDEDQKKFIITSASKWRETNPDVISFSSVTGCETRIDESKYEETTTNKEGKTISYRPPHYNYSYSFKATFDDIVGHNPNFKRTLELAQTAARSDASILLLGEIGVGKDIMAQAIHNASTRRNNPYVAINCGAIPRELIASELFGYQEGAYTGARKGGNAGKFEIADGGTVFLDEIGEMSLDLQVHLLRVLENHTVTRVGGSEPIPVNVRIIAATNADLYQSVQNGLFRSDLYYRLNVISLHLPPLRERRDDIPSLIRHFYSQYYDGTPDVPEEFEEVLCEYSWPGNIRELRNIIERTVSLSPDKQLRTDYLPSHLTAVQEPEPGYAAALSARSEPVTVSELEKEALIARLRATNGNISRTAKELGVARTTIYRKIRQYHIDLESINWKQKNNPLFEDTDQAFPNAQPSSFR